MNLEIRNNEISYQSFSDNIKNSCEFITEISNLVKINEINMEKFIEKIDLNYFAKEEFLNYFNNHLSNIKDHSSISNEDLIAYVCVVDSLNFCFWPLEKEYIKEPINFEYDDYVKNLNKIFEEDINFFSPEQLINLKIDDLKLKVFSNLNFPLLDERLRSLKELGYFIKYFHNGKFENFIEYCQYDCERVIYIIQKYF